MNLHHEAFVDTVHRIREDVFALSILGRRDIKAPQKDSNLHKHTVVGDMTTHADSENLSQRKLD